MAFNVSLSQGVLANLLALSNTTDQMNTVQNRLATGKKVNSALDNPTNFFLGFSFQTSINVLNERLDAITIGQRTIEEANNGITGLTSLIQSAQGSLNQALASAATTAVLTGTTTTISGSAISSSLAFTAFGFVASDVITVTDGSTAVTTTATNTIATFQSSLAASTNGKVRLEIAGDGRILLEGAAATAAVTISTNSGSTTALANLGFNSNTNGGSLNTTAASTGVTNSTRTALAAQFNALRTQIDQLVVDSQYNGVALLNSQSLTVFTNETSTAKVILTGLNATSTGLGLTSTFAANTFQDNYEVNAAITATKAALVTLQNQASTYASQVSILETRAQFTKQTTNNLNTGINDLTLADSNQVGAQLLALQTRQSLSSTALSLSTQADQNVLRLFR
jgi:flagellin